MSTLQNTPSPKVSRPKHQHSKSASQVQPSDPCKPPQGRSKGNRRRNGNNATSYRHGSGVEMSPSRPAINPHDSASADGAVLSSEETHMPRGPRNAKKYGQRPQLSPSRAYSSPVISPAGPTNSELTPKTLFSTPVKAAREYAGPAFHASPAASALPMPSFLSRSVPAKMAPFARPPTPLEDTSDEPSSPTPSPPSPSPASIAIPARHQDSPLDILFNADRAERSRKAESRKAVAPFGPTLHPRPEEDESLKTVLHNGGPAPTPTKTTKKNLFMPASVSAKKFSSTKAPFTSTPSPDSLSQEQILKSLLSLRIADDAAGVRQAVEPAS